ncbi:MAG TPA: HEAT repeat domain-containing protein, partial [Pirellulaceae bacterium]|nr:HEAT repeat domain-containing protein [Pirellulaceae bacterium]
SYEPQAELNPLELSPLFRMTDEAFRQRFRATPLWRPKRRGLLRNAAIALGNQRDPSAIPALALGLFDVEPLVRGAAAWALGRIASTVSRSHLERRFAMEIDEYVRSEIQAALLTAPALD